MGVSTVCFVVKFVGVHAISTNPALLIPTCSDLYYLAFPEDRALNKVLVYGIFLAETAQVALLLCTGVPIYAGFQHLYRYSLPREEGTVMWAAVPLLGGIGMIPQICKLSSVTDLRQQSFICCTIILRISHSCPCTLMGDRDTYYICKIFYPLLQ